MASTQIPSIEETDLDRDDLVEAAEELDVEDHESLDDQELFLEIGRRMGEIDEDDVPAANDDAPDDEQDAASPAAGAQESIEELTRNEIRDELRELGLPVSGNKSELVQRLEAARAEARQADEDEPDEATDARQTDGDEPDAADESEEARDADDGQQAEATEDRKQARDRGEYRVEDDPRDDVAPILDLELGPLALDILGLDVHLNRVHAVVVANPGPRHALLGKLLSGVAVLTDKLGVPTATDKVTEGVETVVDALPSPEDPIDGDDQDDEDDEGPGLLRRVGRRAVGAARGVRDLARHGTDAVGNAKDAAVDGVTSGGNLSAAKEAKDAAKSTVKAGSSAKDAATGTG
jgi:hypothetical protein